jgi:transcriptional regulator with XRE-family HTH domain
VVQSVADLGRLARAHRKTRGLTLETVSGLANLSVRFLSEFERGKPTAEVGKVLKALRTLGLEVVIRRRRAPPPAVSPGGPGPNEQGG